MTPLWLIAIFFGGLAFYSATYVPKLEREFVVAKADMVSTNMIAYKSCVLNYLEANPSASGTIDDATLQPFCLNGFTKKENWTNEIITGTPYVYSQGDLPFMTFDAIYKKSGKSLLVGKKNPSTGRLVSPNGIDTGINLPPTIPNNSVVLFGK